MNSGFDDFRGQIDLSGMNNLQIRNIRDIRKIINSTIKDRFIGVPVTGNSLAHLHVVHGDLLIVRLTSDFEENALCVWQTPKGRAARFAYKEADYVILHNYAEYSRTFLESEIKMIGVVVRIERDIRQGKV